MMTEHPEAPAPPPEASPEEKGEKKKKNKEVRSAWISFTGRILAQIVGAAASIFLGLLILNKGQGKVGKGVEGPRTGTQAEQRIARVRPAQGQGEVALAVLPLHNLSADPQQQYFADGMTEALITDLAHIDGLRVISRTSSMY